MKATEITTTTENKAITVMTAPMKAKNLDGFLGRAEQALGEIGVTSQPSITGIEFEITPPIPEVDLSATVALEDMLIRIEKRANKKLNATDHPFSFYDFKQAIGIVADIKAGLQDAENTGKVLEGRRTPKPKKVKKTVVKKMKVKVVGKSVNLKPVPESDATSDRINEALDKKKAKVETKNAKVKAKVSAELDAQIKATEDAIAVEEAQEKEKRDAAKAKTKSRKAKAKTKK